MKRRITNVDLFFLTLLGAGAVALLNRGFWYLIAWACGLI